MAAWRPLTQRRCWGEGEKAGEGDEFMAVSGAVDSLIIGTADPHRRVETLRNLEKTHKER